MPAVEIPPPAPPPPPPAASGVAPDAPVTLAGTAPALSATLGTLRRRAAGQLVGTGALLALGAAGIVLFLAVILLALRQGWARPVGWGVAGLAALGVLIEGIRRSRLLGRDQAAAARALGRVSPEDASDLLSAVELAHAAEGNEPALSRALVRAHVARMGARAARIDPRSAINGRPLLLACGVLACVVILHEALYKLGGPRVHEAYSFLAGSKAAEATPLFAPEPIAGDIALTYHYPEHMKRTPRVVPGSEGAISAPKGTSIDITARADRDVQRAAVVITIPGKQPTVIPLEVKGRALSGRILITDSGDWRFRYTKPSGSLVAEGPPQPIAIEADQVPEIHLLKPAQELEVSGHEVLTLSYSASDDYGLRAIELVWSAGHGNPEQRKRLFDLKEAVRRDGGDFTWDVGQLGLKPGDRVTYRLEAFDNDSVSGGQTGKKGVSNSQVLKVFSETEHHEEVLKQAQEQWEKLVGGMGDRLEEPPCGEKGEQTTEQWATATRSKDGMLAALATDMRSLAHKLTGDKHAPPEIGRALAHVGSRLFSTVDATASARHFVTRSPNFGTAGAFLATLATEVHEEEKDVLYLEDLLDRQRLLDLAALTRELQEGRKELSNLVAQYKAAPTEQNKQRILAEVARLKERLNDLYKRMRELASDVQDEHLNNEARQLMDEGNDVMSKLDEIQRDLSKGGGDDALKALQDLDKQLSKMEQQFSKSAGDTSEENKKVKAELQQLESDLMDVQGDQAALKKETDQIRAKQRQAELEKSQKLTGEDFVKKQRDRVRKAKSELGSVDQRLAEGLNEAETLQQARDRLNQLDQALQAGDFDEALNQAQQATKAGDELRLRLTEEGTFQFFGSEPGKPPEPGPLGQAGQHTDQAIAPMRQVTEDLEKLMRNARPAASEADRKQMQEMSKREASVERRTGDLKNRLDKLLQQTPIAGPEQTQMLQSAAESMGGAQEKLGDADSRGASSRQADAMEKLKKFAQSMRQRSGSGQGDESSGMPMPFGAGSDEMASGDEDGQDGKNNESRDVEIPTADQSHAPAEFRKDILDAMKDRAPEKYKEKVRNYYEELVK